MSHTRRYGPRGCRSTPIQEHGSSASTPHSAPIPQREPMPHISSSSEDEIRGLQNLPNTEPHSRSCGQPEPVQPDVTEDSSTLHTKTNAYWTVDVIDDKDNRSQKRLRVRDVIPNHIGFRVLTNWNAEGQPVGNSAGLLAGFLGSIASNFDKFPIMYKNWRKVPGGYKDNIYDQTIKEKFVVNDGDNKKYILTSLGKKWRDNRCKIFREYYDWELSREQNLQKIPPSIDKDHWRIYLDHRLSQKQMEIADKNAENRQKQQIPHTLGSKTLARKRDEMELQDGRHYSRAEMYQIAHKKRDGDFVNDEAREKHEQLQHEILESSSENDAFVKVFGKEHPGYVRGMGLGVTPTQLFGGSSHSATQTDANAKMAKMQVEIDALKAQVAEVDALKAQVAEVDVLKEQLAFLMQTVKRNQPDLESPNGVRLSSGSSHIGDRQATSSRGTI